MKTEVRIEVRDDFIWNDTIIKKMGKLAGQAFERKFNAMFCEQAGHIPQELPRIGPVCQRCSLYLGGDE